MTKGDITHAIGYIRSLNQRLRSRDSGASHVLLVGLMGYGWSIEGLLNSQTRLMAALKPYLCCALQMFKSRLISEFRASGVSRCSACQRKRLHDDGPEGHESHDKRRRVHRSGASASLSDHDSQENSAGLESPGSSAFQTHPSSLLHMYTINGARELTDPTAMGSLGRATSIEFASPSFHGMLHGAVNGPNEFMGPATANILDGAADQWSGELLGLDDGSHEDTAAGLNSFRSSSEHLQIADPLADITGNYMCPTIDSGSNFLRLPNTYP